MGRPRNSVERMLVVDVETGGDCWVWKGPVATNGYGKAAICKKPVLPHRAFYEHFKGPIAPGMQIDHLCKNKLCVNPAHLDQVTPRENTLRGDGPAARNAKKTHCLAGHELAGSNLYVTPDGRRQCRTCQRNRDKR
jgi:hypothetical protein